MLVGQQLGVCRGCGGGLRRWRGAQEAVFEGPAGKRGCGGLFEEGGDQVWERSRRVVGQEVEAGVG